MIAIFKEVHFVAPIYVGDTCSNQVTCLRKSDGWSLGLSKYGWLIAVKGTDRHEVPPHMIRSAR